MNRSSAIQNTVRPKSYGDTISLTYDIANLQNIGACEKQGDSFAFVHALDEALTNEKGLFAVLADGLGGMSGGAEESKMVVSCISGDVKSFNMQKNIPEQIRRSILQAHKKVNLQTRGNGGCTAILCAFYLNQLYFGSVGDSAVFLYRNQNLVKLNAEHHLLNRLYLEAIRNNNFYPFDIRKNENCSALTQFLGKDGEIEIDMSLKPLALFPGDVIMVCSDGISEYLSTDWIQESLNQRTAEDMCQSVNRGIAQLNNPDQDNYTAMIIRCEL